MKISGFGEVFTYAQERGSLTLTGCNNIVNLKGCQASIWIIGQNNTFNVAQCCLEIHFNGNDNVLQVSKSQLSVGINGNKNKVETHEESEEYEDCCKIAVLYENGCHNQVPPNVKLSAHRAFPSRREMSNQFLDVQPNSLRPANNFNSYPRFQCFPKQSSYMFQCAAYQPSPMFNHSNPFKFPNFHQPYENPYSRYYEQRQNKRQNLNNYYGNNQVLEYGRSRQNMREMQKVGNPYFLGSRRMQQSRCWPFNRSRMQGGSAVSNSDDWDVALQISHYNILRAPLPQYYFPQSFSPVNQNCEQLCIGLTKQQTDQLPVCKYEGQNSKCPICLQDISKDDDVLFIFCFHSFHAGCCLNWFKKSVNCPICQIDVRAQLQKNS